MEFQNIMIIIQTCIAAISLIVSFVTLGKVNEINKTENINKGNNQIAIGKRIKQEREN